MKTEAISNLYYREITKGVIQTPEDYSSAPIVTKDNVKTCLRLLEVEKEYLNKLLKWKAAAEKKINDYNIQIADAEKEIKQFEKYLQTFK